MKLISKKHKGQGVVEYAGAIVVAGAIVAAVISVAPDKMKTMFQTVIDNVSAKITGTSGGTGGTTTP